MLEFIQSRWQDILFRGYQHTSLVLQSVLLATAIAIVLAAVVISRPKLKTLANAITSIGMTIPSFALLGITLPLLGIGTTPSVVLVTFYATLPILRNAVTGLSQVPDTLLESSRGMGQSGLRTFLTVRLPLAWPVIMTGIRVSTQMAMGIAAIAAYALGPGLGGYIYTGLAQLGGVNALNYTLVGTVGIVIIALIVDALLLLIGRITTSRGIQINE